ncbi:small integral membrane protein 12 [Diorhabda carinulata]|uniref:small integral membrane protein 12 n=1 Tax=Diorhabda sublineata TaxID=1163346 RepID=UPI0024E140A2|nr:small integral membrane protein 12 [Diorhabda sublineata]XP_057668924.1 small integral membrane protein 12 [Diorhabda carinulata]
MWPIIYNALRTYAPYVTLPFAALVGVVGYNLENWLSDKYTPYNKSVKDQRQDRVLTENLSESNEKNKLKYKTDVLDTNLSPSLS